MIRCLETNIKIHQWELEVNKVEKMASKLLLKSRMELEAIQSTPCDIIEKKKSLKYIRVIFFVYSVFIWYSFAS